MDNKKKLMECALKLFSSKGYEAVGVQEIATAAGVTKPTLYYYFGSKEQLLREVLSEGCTFMLETIEQAASCKGGLLVKIHNITVAYFEYARVHRTFFHMLLSLKFSPPNSDGFKIVEPYINDQIKMIEDVFDAASKEDENIGDNHKAYAISYFGMMNAYIEYYIDKLEDHEPVVWEELIEKVNDQFMHGIYS